MKNKITLLVLLLVCVMVVGITVARANTDNIKDLIIKGTIDRLVEIIMNGENFSLGERSDADTEPTYLDDGEWTYIGDVYADDLEVIDDAYFRDDVAVSGDLNITDELQYGGVELDWISGTCIDATTTPISILNPYSATVYLNKFVLYIENGTSTIAMTCGTSTTAGSLSADPTDLLIDDLAMASSTVGTATTTGYIINGDDYAGTGMLSPGTNSEDVIPWKSGEYIKCFVDTTYAGAWTEITNIAECTYKIHTFR